jgi:hypothetical protein
MVLCGGLEKTASKPSLTLIEKTGLAKAIIIITDESHRALAEEARNAGYSGFFSNVKDREIPLDAPIVLRRSDKPLPEYLSRYGIKIIHYDHPTPQPWRAPSTHFG